MKTINLLIIPIILCLLFFFRLCPVPKKKTGFDLKVPTITVGNIKKFSLLNQIGLTKEQRLLIQRKRAQYRKDNVQIESEIDLKKVELENELENAEPEISRVDALCGQIGFLYGEKLKIRLWYQLEIEKKILTPDQSAKMEDFREEGNFKCVSVVYSE